MSEPQLEVVAAQKHPRTLRLSPDEVAELTERLLEWRDNTPAAETEVELGTLLKLLEPHRISQGMIDKAVDGLLENRRRRLSSVLARKAHELERMFFGLLERIDHVYQSECRLRMPSRPPGACIDYRTLADRGDLEIRVLYTSPAGYSERLFTVFVCPPKRPGYWKRLTGSAPMTPKRVVVHSQRFAGETVEQLLTWTLKRTGGDVALSTAAAFAVENLHKAIVDELERTMRFVNDLSFDNRQ